MAMKPKDRIELYNAKLRVAKVLQDHGEAVDGRGPVQYLISACTRKFGGPRVNESSREYFDRIAESAPKPRARYVGQKVEAFVVDLMKRPEWKPEPHLRAADIDALPPIIGVHGIGNGVNWSHVDL